METNIRDAYFAGLIDGEGYIGFAKKGLNGRRPIISVNMTCEKTLLAIQSHFGVGTVRPKPKRPPERMQWIWRVYYFDALAVAQRIGPYLITKADNVSALLSYTPKRKSPLRGAS